MSTTTPPPPAQGTTTVVTITKDLTLDRRKVELYMEVANVIKSGGGKVRRSKRGVVSYGHGKGTGVAAQVFWRFTVLGGAVLAVAGAVGFAAIGWWALIPGVAVGVLYAVGSAQAQRKTTKSTVIEWLKGVDKQLETNAGYKPEAKVERDGTLVESILTILIQEHNRFEKKTTKYYADEAVRKARLKLAFDQAKTGTKLGKSIKKIKASKTTYKVDDPAGDDTEKLAVIIARERVLIRFARSYLNELQSTVKSFYEKDLADLDKVVDQFVTAQIGVHAFHDPQCDSDCCFGPGHHDMGTAPVADPTLVTSVTLANTEDYLERFKRESSGAGGFSKSAALGGR